MNISVIILSAVTVGLALICLKLFHDVTELRARYSGLVDIDSAIALARKSLDRSHQEQRDNESENRKQRATLTDEYSKALVRYNDLKREVSLLEENLDDISFGLYEPHFNFGTSDEYRSALEEVRNRQKAAVRDGRAAVCPVNWTVGNNAREGAKMVREHQKLVLRAFNGECEAAVSDVAWNNATKMEARIRKSFEAANSLGGVLKITLTNEYLKLKLDEIHLAHEYQEKRHQEKEEQRRIREQIRDEERAQQEIEAAREEAEAEEARFQKALAKARQESEKATGAQLQKLTDQINSFEAKLDEARKKKERAISRAQVTKSGFVYVISNLGAFGEHVYKIGMTRRMEPMERIYELGGASVPFPFDLHAMLYSDDAPALEGALHQFFSPRRLNLVNARREFYHSVQLEEIETFTKERGLSAQFIRQAEAREYRETLAKREDINKKPVEKERFSASLFDGTEKAFRQGAG